MGGGEFFERVREGLAAETTPGKGIQRLNSHACIEPVARREEVTVLEATVQKILAQQKALVQAPILFFLLNAAAKGLFGLPKEDPSLCLILRPPPSMANVFHF